MLFSVSFFADTKVICEMTVSTKTFLSQRVYSLFPSEEEGLQSSHIISNLVSKPKYLNYLISTFWITNEIEHISIHLSAQLYIFRNCLFKYLPIFLQACHIFLTNV